MLLLFPNQTVIAFVSSEKNLPFFYFNFWCHFFILENVKGPDN